MAQNIYDDQTFFDEYAKMPRSIQGLSGAPEWKWLRPMLGNVSGKRILDLGCGYGRFCQWAIENRAANVHGVDVSQKMIDQARSDALPSNLTYEIADLDILQLPKDSYDTVYSSLAFHYVHDLERLFGQIQSAIPSGGKLVFSVEHPIFTAPSSQKWQTSEGQDPVWPLNNYFREGLRHYDWLGSSVQKCHRTMETYLRMLIRSGFTILDIQEFRPSDEDLKLRPDWYNDWHRPMFLLISARKE